MRRHTLAPAALTALVACFAAASFAAAGTAHAAWQWPVEGEVITPYRNGTDPYAAGQHRGIDIAAPVGATVRAAAGGDVRFAGTAGSSGLTISIRTGDGYDTSYLHLSSLDVRAGAHVSAGDRIGAVGTTGSRSAAAPHLHFGVRDAGTRHAYHDPLAFLPPPATSPRSPAPPPAAAPQAAPAPPAAAPAPATQGVPAGGGAPEQAPERLPARRAAPHGVNAPERAPRPVPAPTGAPRRVLAPAAPSNEIETVRAMRGSGAAMKPRHASPAGSAPPGMRASLEPGPGSEDPLKAVASASPPAVGRSPNPGPDIGWALACAGLLLAAGILGLTGDGRRGGDRTRPRLSSALRPLIGRH